MAWLDAVACTVRRSLALACFGPCAVAAAHGGPPAAYSVLVADEHGPVLVKLGAGVARRRSADVFQFVCPAAWGDEDGSPAAALADGSVVIGATDGLMLLSPDGAVRPHPDPNARGYTTELVRNDAGVFSLRLVQGRTEVLAVDAEAVHEIWSDTRSWYSMAALRQGVVLVRASGTNLEQVSLAHSGAEIDRRQAAVSAPVDYVFARSVGDEAYVLLLSQMAPELGRVADGMFTGIAKGASSIAGPLSEAGELLLAIDGKLSVLRDGTPAPLADDNYVSCLDRAAEQSFACTRVGVARATGAGVTDTVFSLSSLVAPDSSAIADEKLRVRCDYQWQDLRFDLIAIGMPPTNDRPEPSDAGLDAGEDVQEGEPDTGKAGAAAAEDEEEPVAEPSKGSSACSLREGTRADAEVQGWMLLLALVCLRRRS